MPKTVLALLHRTEPSRPHKTGPETERWAIQSYVCPPNISPTSPPHPSASSIKPAPFPPTNKEEGYTPPAPHTPLSRYQRFLIGRHSIHGASRPAVGRHGGRAAAGPRPRQAPQVRLLLPVLHRLRDDRRRAVGRRGGAGGDAEHHHPPPADSVRDVAAQRVRLRALVPGQRPGLPLRHSNDTQGRGLEQAAPERQDGRRRHGRRQPRHPQEPHRVRLGGDQLTGPLITDRSSSTKTTENSESTTRAAAN